MEYLLVSLVCTFAVANGEEWKMFELPRPIRISLDPVQSVHIAVQGDTKVKVMWLNPTPFMQNKTFNPACQYGTTVKLGITVKGNAYSYPAGMFHSTLNDVDLNLNQFPNPYIPVFYKCGDEGFGWSPVRNFTLHRRTVPGAHLRYNDIAAESQNEWDYINRFSIKKTRNENRNGVTPKLAFVGDMGVVNAEHTIASLHARVNTGEVQAIIHAGDIGYANKYSLKAHNNSYIWVDYMNEIQELTSRVPYMCSPGNHESQFHFAAYLNWFQQPYNESGSTSPFWYSFDYMGIHFVMFSTEHNFAPGSEQFRWMQKDLEKANTKRTDVPWVFVVGHRPLYCTSLVESERCVKQAPVYRENLEDLLFDQKVDVFMSGHNHQYERSYPIYKLKATQKDYVNPKAPVYIVNGGAGNPELNDPTFVPDVKWRAFDDPTFKKGFMLLEVKTKSLHFQYIRSEENTVVDDFAITRT